MEHLTLYKFKFIDIDDCGELFYCYDDVWAIDLNYAVQYLANKYDLDFTCFELV